MEIVLEIVRSIAGKTIGLILALGAFVTGTTQTPPALPTSSTTTPPIVVEIVATTTPAQSAAEPQTSAPATSAAIVAKPAPATVATTPSAPKPPPIAPEILNANTRAALVNILCMPQRGINGISGSGVIIDNRGVILTNAHIAQYFLLKDYLFAGNVDCTIRTGSPAARMYRATLLYLPPEWVIDNASQLKSSAAVGTGENDYAFLLITERTDPQALLPPVFPSIGMSLGFPDTGEQMLLAAYPAGFLSSELIERSLYASSALAFVTQLFSFDGNLNKVDLYSIGGTVVSQGGSSGGAAVRTSDGRLSGIISTAILAGTTGERDLRALTLWHINKGLENAGAGGIPGLLSGDVVKKAADFNAVVAPGEKAALEAALN